VPQLGAGSGYWCTVQLTTSSWIVAAWQDNGDANKQLLIYPGNPFAGPTDPVATSPPGGNVSTSYPYLGQLWAATVGCQTAGTYTVYFWNSGPLFVASTGYAWVVTGCGQQQRPQPSEDPQHQDNNQQGQH
jgi:hypothetical protein